MPPVTSTAEYGVAEKGIYVTTLVSIAVKSAPQKRDDGTTYDSSFWVWTFRGYKERDKDKRITSVEITTSTGVSKKDSALKHLLSSAYPDMEFDEMKQFDTDEMIGKNWRIQVSVEPKASGNGDRNKIIRIDECDIDPFSDDE